MSERANGWLLIFGGLAIGLTLWFSPSTGAPSSEFEALKLVELDRVKAAAIVWDCAIFKAAMRIEAVCLDECPPPCRLAGDK